MLHTITNLSISDARTHLVDGANEAETGICERDRIRSKIMQVSFKSFKKRKQGDWAMTMEGNIMYTKYLMTIIRNIRP